MSVNIERVYCLARCGDGRWLLLNRRYKPWGVGADPRSWFNYEHCGGARVWLRERDLRALDGGVTPYRPGDRMLWLYRDETDPRLSAACRHAYERRLAVLDLAPEEEVA